MKAFVYINKKSGKGRAEKYFYNYLIKFINENFQKCILIISLV